ncbi:hypothetical protein QFC22_005737 [Naganishia vaughanmartiniae]|uniref:Uncharacterized protein n=1 Tax=Naganishia vaughanmartiniae TaxID=1424756 RepID=A0ACC2WSW6_9TREE|nr:hypothetical protein QFC22_005737 [Naganishia vaughanmartiniae]
MFPKSLFTAMPLLAAFTTLVRADVIPSSPDGSTVVKVGATAEAMWAKDMNGTWTDVTVKLMTGDNFNMVEVTTLAENVDGTTTDSLSWMVPEVTPNSKIYFLQFSSNASITPEWTTRFTIAAADGTITDPTNSTQPGGASIPWGTGYLVSGGNITTGSTAASSNSTSAVTSSSSTMIMSTSSSASPTTSAAVAAVSESASSMTTSISRSVSSSNSAAAASATAAKSGATSVQVAGGLVALVGFVAGFMVL